MKRLLRQLKWFMLACIPSKLYVVKRFKRRVGYSLNLKNPTTFCEKLQWLKLYNHNPLYTDMVDKYKVKKIAKECGANVIPLLGVYKNFSEIDFDKLPNQFVLKTNHCSGGYVVCKDKKTFDKKKAKQILEKSLKTNYFLLGREWPYKNVERRIIAEEYIQSLGNIDSIEYKYSCFNGKVKFLTVCRGIPHSDYVLRKNDFYDRDFNFMPFVTNYYSNSGLENKKPSCHEKMVEISERLAKDIPYLRVDFYVIDGIPYFGEATFFTWAGFLKFVPPEYDRILGEWLELPKEKVVEKNFY